MRTSNQLITIKSMASHHPDECWKQTKKYEQERRKMRRNIIALKCITKVFVSQCCEWWIITKKASKNKEQLQLFEWFFNWAQLQLLHRSISFILINLKNSFKWRQFTIMIHWHNVWCYEASCTNICAIWYVNECIFHSKIRWIKTT